jgi:hypothetical protein
MYFFMTFFASLVALSDTSSILCALRHLLSRKLKRVVRLNQNTLCQEFSQTDWMKSDVQCENKENRTCGDSNRPAG